MRRHLFAAVALLAVCAGTAHSQESPAVSAGPAVSATYRADGPGIVDFGGSSGDSRIWGSASYMLWWLRDAPVGIPVATTGSAADPRPGALGQPGTSVVSPNHLDAGSFSGTNFTIGAWLSDDDTLGVEVGGFLLESRSASFSVSSQAGGTVFYAPYTDQFAGAKPTPAAFTFGFPGSTAGSISMTSNTRLWGTEANGLYTVAKTDAYALRLLAGFRYLDLQEDLDIGVSGSLPGVFTTTSADRFGTRNQFWGGQLGARGESRFVGSPGTELEFAL